MNGRATARPRFNGAGSVSVGVSLDQRRRPGKRGSGHRSDDDGAGRDPTCSPTLAAKSASRGRFLEGARFGAYSQSQRPRPRDQGGRSLARRRAELRALWPGGRVCRQVRPPHTLRRAVTPSESLTPQPREKSPLQAAARAALEGR
jgi:hypothetical protein